MMTQKSILLLGYGYVGKSLGWRFLMKALSFLKENKRVLTVKMKEFLEGSLTFPSYREGLKDIFEKGLF